MPRINFKTQQATAARMYFALGKQRCYSTPFVDKPAVDSFIQSQHYTKIFYNIKISIPPPTQKFMGLTAATQNSQARGCIRVVFAYKI